jgi:hypothetical protein
MPPVPVRRTLAQTHRTDRPRSGMTSSTHGPAAASTGIRAHKPRFNPLHPDVLASPYGSYQRMRQEAPVLFDRRFGWLVFRYDDVERSSKRPAPVGAAAGAGRPGAALIAANCRRGQGASRIAGSLVALRRSPAPLALARAGQSTVLAASP